jgi:Protein of unknown function (DUF998)
MSTQPLLVKLSPSAARLAFGAAAAVLLLLASLHVLSPEFDPAWRVVSEYADGRYGWVLSLMFAAWALSLWALAFAIWPKAETSRARIGVVILLVSGVGPALASVSDLHHSLHDVAGAIGLLCLPVAASLVSVNLNRTQPIATRKSALIWTANLIWISLFLFVATMALMIVTYLHAGGKMDGHVQVLPPGVVAYNGWANRFFLVTCAIWAMTVARHLGFRSRL